MLVYAVWVSISFKIFENIEISAVNSVKCPHGV